MISLVIWDYSSLRKTRSTRALIRIGTSGKCISVTSLSACRRRIELTGILRSPTLLVYRIPDRVSGQHGRPWHSPIRREIACSQPRTTLSTGSAPPELQVLNHATLAEQVYQHLRQQILGNAFPPNAALPEKTLASQLNVSRVPVREALHKLAADGLVTLKPRQGAFVSSLSPRQFLDAYRVREALEDLAIRLALPNLTHDDLAELGRLQGEMRQYAAADDADAFFAANHAFHALFVERSAE